MNGGAGSAGRGCGGCRRSPAAPARTRAGSGRCRTRSASAGCASGTPGRDWHAAIQVDHMTLSGDGVTLKGFHAVAPGDRRFCGRMYSRANSGCAADFLRRLVGEWGADAVCRIQVDGGSEFMGEFERACMQLGIELLVLPARRPQWNGLVERINRTVRTECWNHYRGEWNCRAMNERMDEYIRFYNNERPHHSLGMKTPAEAATMTGVSA